MMLLLMRNYCWGPMLFLLFIPVLIFSLLKRQCYGFGFSTSTRIRIPHYQHSFPHVNVGRSIIGTSLRSQHLNESEDTDTSPPASASSAVGELEKLKQEEAKLASMLASVRRQKLSVLRARPLNMGIIGFGRFGQFIAKSFAKYGHVIGTSRTDYSTIASEMGAKYIPLSDLESFVVEEDLDVIVLAVSIVSFEETVKDLVPHLQKRMEMKGTDSCPLIVDVASVKEHPRNILLQHLPEECDVLSTHPMFGPDSARDGWQGQTFVYEKTRVNKVVFEPDIEETTNGTTDNDKEEMEEFFHEEDISCGALVECDEHVERMDRIERFLSIWEEEGCKMTPLSCHDHDAYAANSQFITHLVGRILGAQGLHSTPIDTKGFQSVLKLIENTNADSFDLFYGLYKYNRNSGYTIGRLRGALDDVVGDLLQRDGVVGVFSNRRNNLN